MFAQESVMDIQKEKKAIKNLKAFYMEDWNLTEEERDDLDNLVSRIVAVVKTEAQAVPEWIETAIQPPEEGQKVIISGIYGVGIAEFSYLYKDEFVMYDMGASNPILSKDQVKFWMPLPDAPQEQK